MGMATANANSKPRGRGAPPVSKLTKIKIEGFKSIKSMEFDLSDVNVLVGINGSGKSNFLHFFDMLGAMVRGKNLALYVGIKGGANDLLFHGSENTREISCEMTFELSNGTNEYHFTLQPTEDNQLVFSREECRFTPTNRKPAKWHSLGVGHNEAKITDMANGEAARAIRKMLQNCTIYQFNDTTAFGPFKKSVDIVDCVFLQANGRNLAAVLYDLQQNESAVYQSIVECIRLVLPVFQDFYLHPKYGKISLAWSHEQLKDKVMGAHLTSDGTLRLFALTTLLHMPADRISNIVLLDEPELGLHPYAIRIVADLIKLLGNSKQIIIASQSSDFLNEFDMDDIIITTMTANEQTEFERKSKVELKDWLDDFQIGEIWKQNVMGGNP